MVAVMLQNYNKLKYNFYKNISKNRLFSANTNEKLIVSTENCIAYHDEKLSFLPKCRYHIILMGDNNYPYSYSTKLIDGNRKKSVLVHFTP